MQSHIYSVEELMLDDSFVSWCLHYDAKNSSHWHTIIRDNPNQTEVFNEAKELIKLLHGGLSKNEINRQIEKVRLLLLERKKEQVEDEANRERATLLSSNFIVTGDGRIKKKAFRVFAISTATVCLFFLMIWGFPGIKPSGDLIAKEFTPAVTFQCALGQRHNVTLPDGSEVILNSTSSISLDQDFNKSRREVKLTGDAFFRVAKNASKPFVVFTNNISTEALGTEFYIQSKEDNKEGIKIDLLEGKVKVEIRENTAPQKNIILLPGERTETDDGIHLHKTTFDKTYLEQWIDGNISFDNIPVTSAIQKLQVWYDVEIKVNKEELKNRKISGEYNNVSIQDILKVICFSINKKFNVSGNTFIIE